MVRDNHEVTVLAQSAVPTLASFLRRQEPRQAGHPNAPQARPSIPFALSLSKGPTPHTREPPRRHPHPPAAAAHPPCVIPAKASIQTSGAPPPPTPS